MPIVGGSGLALLAFRTTAAMDVLLALHFSIVLGLFVLLPYRKFVHAVLRTLALIRNATDGAARGRCNGGQRCNDRNDALYIARKRLHKAVLLKYVRTRIAAFIPAIKNGGRMVNIKGEMVNINDRIERLPITSEHKFAVLVMAMAYFFELEDQSTFPYAATGLIVHWHIAVSVVALITSATFGGMLLGGILAGHAAGTLGRKKAFLLAILVFSGGSLLDALSWNVYSLAIFRFATGFGMTALTIVANTYITEIIPARVRGRYMAVVMTIGFIGIPVTALFARFIIPLFPWGWRGVFLWGGLGIVMVPFVFRLPESPRWLVTMGRERDAEDIVKKFEKAAISEFGTLETAVSSEFTEPGNDEGRGQYRELFSQNYRRRTIVLLMTWTFVSMGFYGFYAWAPALLVKQGFSLVKSLDYSSLMAICNPIGAALAILFIEKFERKFFFGACAVLVAGSVIFYGSSFQPTLIVIFGAFAILGMQAGMVALYAYTPEIFPTKIRSHGMALTFGGGRISNIIGAFVISSLYGFGGYYSVFLFVSFCWLVGAALVAVFGPRVTGRALEEIGLDPESQQLLPAAPSSGYQPR